MSAGTTGAELRARRERLGLSVEWAAKIISDAGLNRTAQHVANLEASCCIARDWFATAPIYAAALTAEEQRRSAAPLTEPVAPEGVVVRSNNAVESHGTIVSQRGATDFAVVWDDGGSPRIFGANEVSAEALEYVAALSRYRAAQHAAGEQQRKLNAVRAAEEALEKSRRAYDEAFRAREAAKREAGL